MRWLKFHRKLLLPSAHKQPTARILFSTADTDTDAVTDFKQDNSLDPQIQTPNFPPIFFFSPANFLLCLTSNLGAIN